MSMMTDIENMIFECFCDGEIHTSQEFKDKAVEKGIISDDNVTAVSNTVFKIKDDPRFEVLDKGRYLVREKNTDDKISTVENSFIYLIKRLKNMQKMTLMNSSREEFDRAYNDKELYIRYVNELYKMMKDKWC